MTILIQNGKRRELTSKQNRFLDFVLHYQIQNGQSPTQAEIAAGLGLKSLNSVQKYLNILREKGVLRKEKDSRREVEIRRDVFDAFASVARIPLLGKISAGKPIEAIEGLEEMEVPSRFLKPGFQHFVLCVEGNSMVEDHICEGDYVVVRQQVTANDGDVVVALIDNEATLKRLRRTKGRIELHPANADYRPIIVESHQQFRIAGVMTGLIRTFGG